MLLRRNITNCGKLKISASLLFATLYFASYSSAISGEWRIKPTASLEQSVTDNAFSTDRNRKADLITTTSAGIGITGNGARVKLDFNYDISRDWYWDNEDLGGLRHRLSGASNVELWEDNFFVETRASVAQQSLQRTGGVTADERTAGTNDQSVVVNYSVTPRLRRRYGNWAESDIRLEFSENRFLDADTGTAGQQPDATRNIGITTQLRSGNRFNRLKWELSGNQTFTNNDTDRDLLELSGEYALLRSVSLVGRVGRETIDNSGINSDNSAELFWRGGIRLTPGPRSSFRVEYGRRFNGSNFDAEASYKIGPETAISAAYNETVRTQDQLLTASLNQLVVDLDNLDQAFVDDNGNLNVPVKQEQFDFNFIANRVFKNRVFSLRLNGVRGRNSFAFTSGVKTQEDLFLNTEDVTVDVSASLRRRIWPNLTGGVNLDISSLVQSESGVDEDFTFRAGAFLEYTLQRNFTGSLQYNHLNRNTDTDANDLVENTVSVIVKKTF